jgi:starch-binding outer membrane protein, SusD/RagB family
MKATMKNIGMAMLLVVALANCNDYLDEKNPSNIEDAEFYKTANGYEALVNSTYASLREVYEFPWVFMAGTDEFVEGRNAQPEGISEYRNLSSNDVQVETFFGACYKAIGRCNAAEYYYDKTEKTATRDTRLGEAKFLRAYYYFLLVQQFGGVSIVTDMYDEPAYNFARNSAAEVYDFILKELTESLALVPETTSSFGRITKPAVLHYLAKVHLTRGYEPFAAEDDYEQAALYADKAINGKTLSISFEDLFWPGKEKNAEVLFAIQFDKSSIKDPANDGSNQNYWFGPYMGGEGAKNGYPYRAYQLMPTTYVHSLFTENDARWEGTFMNVVYSRYYDFYDKSKADRATMNITYYYPQSWEADTAAWRAADPARRAKTRIIPFGSIWMGASGVGIDYSAPAVRKFDDPTATFSLGGSSTRDIYLARLGETYLIAAEAYLQAGNVATATARVNEVRRRAAKPGKVAEMQVAEAVVNIDFLLDERGRELLGEYDRWMDLKRTGKLVERTALYNRDIKRKFFDAGDNAFEGADGQLKLLRPIPQKAIDLNQNEDYGQNPGY